MRWVSRLAYFGASCVSGDLCVFVEHAACFSTRALTVGTVVCFCLCSADGRFLMQDYIPQPKPFLTEQHKKMRVVFCKSREGEPWTLWIFSDEYHFWINGKKGRLAQAVVSCLFLFVLVADGLPDCACRLALQGAEQGRGSSCQDCQSPVPLPRARRHFVRPRASLVLLPQEQAPQRHQHGGSPGGPDRLHWTSARQRRMHSSTRQRSILLLQVGQKCSVVLRSFVNVVFHCAVFLGKCKTTLLKTSRLPFTLSAATNGPRARLT